jgi:hypothetical protein
MKGETKPSGFDLVSGAQMKTDSRGDGGVSGVWKMRWWVIERANRYHVQGLGVWAKRPKLSSGGDSVSGVPVETGGGGDGGGRVGVGNEVVVVVGTAN